MRPRRPGAPGARRDFRPGPRGRARRCGDKEVATRTPPADPVPGPRRPPARRHPLGLAQGAIAGAGGQRAPRRCDCGATESTGNPPPLSRTAAEDRARRRRPAGAKRRRRRGPALGRAPPGGAARGRGRGRPAPGFRAAPPSWGATPHPPVRAPGSYRSRLPQEPPEAPLASSAWGSKHVTAASFSKDRDGQQGPGSGLSHSS